MEQNNNSQDTFNTEALEDTEEKDIQEDYGDGFGEEKDDPIPPAEPKEKNQNPKNKDDKKQHNDSKKSVIIAVSSGAVVLIIIIVTLFTVLSFSKRDNTEDTQETTVSIETKETETETKGDNPQPVVTIPVYTTVVTQPTTEPTTEPTTVATTVATEPPTETEAKTEPTVIDTAPQENTVNQDNPIV